MQMYEHKKMYGTGMNTPTKAAWTHYNVSATLRLYRD